MFATLRVVPLLVFPLAAFMLLALALGAGWTTSTFFETDMFSGAHWAVSSGDIFVFVSLLVLFVEIVKSVSTGATEIVNHGLSMLVAVACTILFVTAAAFTNSTFFLLTTMAFIDVVAGFVITIVAARRDFGHWSGELREHQGVATHETAYAVSALPCCPEDPMHSSTFRIMPLMIFPVAVFALLALSMGDGWTTTAFTTFNMYSGATWTMTYGDIFVLVSLLVLFVEILKSVNTESNEILNHGLSVMVAIVCTVMFVTGSAFGNTAFFLLTVMTFVDVIAGFVITIMTARRDFGGAH